MAGRMISPWWSDLKVSLSEFFLLMESMDALQEWDNRNVFVFIFCYNKGIQIQNMKMGCWAWLKGYNSWISLVVTLGLSATNLMTSMKCTTIRQHCFVIVSGSQDNQSEWLDLSSRYVSAYYVDNDNPLCIDCLDTSVPIPWIITVDINWSIIVIDD